MTKKWNVPLFAAIGVLLGGGYAIYLTSLLRSNAVVSHKPIAFDIFGALLGLVVFGGAALSHNHFAESVPKVPE